MHEVRGLMPSLLVMEVSRRLHRLNQGSGHFVHGSLGRPCTEPTDASNNWNAALAAGLLSGLRVLQTEHENPVMS